jgi:hypothetical protein
MNGPIIANQPAGLNAEFPSIPDEQPYPFSACHSRVRLAIPAVVASRIADGVRENRGAGAGCVTP